MRNKEDILNDANRHSAIVELSVLEVLIDIRDVLADLNGKVDETPYYPPPEVRPL